MLGSPFGEDIDRIYDLDDERDLQSVGMSSNETRADRIIHFRVCHHLVLEEKGKAQPLKTAIGQVKATVERARTPNIRYVVIVKQKIPRAEQGFYHWNHTSMRLTYASSPERPVIVANGLPLFLLTPEQAKRFGLV